MTAPLIGLVGKKRAGKDTFAERLIAEHGFVKVSFSAPVKEAALAVDPIIATDPTNGFERNGEGSIIYAMRLSKIVDQFGWEAAKEDPEVRRFLQRLGTDAIRAIDPDFWVRAGMAKAKAIRHARRVERDADDRFAVVLGPRPVVITDVRFKNEAAAIKAAGGILVRVERPGSDDGDTHASEVELDTYPVDKLVYNGGTVEQLHNQADAVAASL